jgi:hypothetical protein
LSNQPEEEAGNAGEQPASNKVAGYKVERWSCVTFFTGILLFLINSFRFISQMHVPFDEVLSVAMVHPPMDTQDVL